MLNDSLLLLTSFRDFHPSPAVGPLSLRQGTPQCKCGLPAYVDYEIISFICLLRVRLLRADQKAKARSRLAPSPTKAPPSSQSQPLKVEADSQKGGLKVIDDDMVFFWQCQSPGQTGNMKGCGFFRILEMKGEGRGPCVGDA